jgi:hypothetical protein
MRELRELLKRDGIQESAIIDVLREAVLAEVMYRLL